jgi:hypothetical protein
MKPIIKGWSKPGDEIPQPIGVVLGGNLRQNSKPRSPRSKDKDERDQQPAAAGGANKEFRSYCLSPQRRRS